ncbi:capping complex subunit for YIEGIA, partial [Clostridioides difficile]
MGMDIGLNEYTLAIVTLDKNMKNGGGCPIFYANDEKD